MVVLLKFWVLHPEPQGQDKELTLDMEKAQAWIAKGAQPTRRVKTLLRKAPVPALPIRTVGSSEKSDKIVV